MARITIKDYEDALGLGCYLAPCLTSKGCAELALSLTSSYEMLWERKALQLLDTWKEEGWCVCRRMEELVPPPHGLCHWMSQQDSAGELDLVVWVQESWQANTATTQAQIQGYEAIQLYELLNL